MSSAPSRIVPRVRRVLRGVAWTVVLAVLAAGAAGLIGLAWHAPGGPARAELTFTGDSTMDARLDAATERLQRIAADVDKLAGEAKTALEEVASTDPARLRAALERGGQVAAGIDGATRDLRDSLTGLPGDGPAAVLDYSNATLVRRAAVLAAVDAAASLANQWQTVTGRAVDAAHLIALIDEHDMTVLAAAAKGRDRQYGEAMPILDDALGTVDEITALRKRLIASAEPTVLDEWVTRTGNYDTALRALYAALVASGGEVTLEVQAARHDEQLALAQLPQNRRTIVVIVAEVARGGLTQAVVAIEDAHGHIDQALAEAP